MLVLSRGENDRIVFPALGISVEVLKVKGSRASLGIDAPKSVRIVRDELMPQDVDWKAHASEDSVALRHQLRNEINGATLKLQLASKLFSAGKIDQGLATLAAGIAELSAINTDSDADAVAPPPAHQVASTPADYTVTGETDMATSERPRVLLVDDDDNERTLMASYLRRCGLHVEEASDGLKALYALSNKQTPDVVLLDMNMPNLNGSETIQRIRACSPHPNVPVFAVTGEAMETTGVTISNDGVTGWFQKPVQVDQIVDAIEDCVAVG